jgi:HNH endonuclease
LRYVRHAYSIPD